MTADDVVFTWEFVADPVTAAVTVGSYREVSRIDKLDSHALTIAFTRPQPFWADAAATAPGAGAVRVCQRRSR